MANVGGIVLAKVTAATSRTYANVTMTAANTEYSYALPANTKYYILQNRGNGKVQIAANTGETNTDFFTVWPGQQKDSALLNSTSFTLYFECSKAGDVLEIESWQ